MKWKSRAWKLFTSIGRDTKYFFEPEVTTGILPANSLYLRQLRQIALKLDFFISFVVLSSGANELHSQSKCRVCSKNNLKIRFCCYSCGRINGYTYTCIKWTNSTCLHEHIVLARSIKFCRMINQYVLKHSADFGSIGSNHPTVITGLVVKLA